MATDSPPPDDSPRSTLRLQPRTPAPARSAPPAAAKPSRPSRDPAPRKERASSTSSPSAGKPRTSAARPAARASTAPAPLQQEGTRLAKHLAEQLQCSRREAELYIEAGAVEVDGVNVQDLGHRVLPGQQVSLRPGSKPDTVAPVTLLLNKPAGYTVGDARRGTPSIAQLLTPEHLAKLDLPAPVKVLERHFRHQQPLLVLPVAASGLTVLTQDARVVRKLSEEMLYIEQECLAEVEGEVSDDVLAQLCDGTAIAGRRLPAIKVSRQSEQRLRFALKGIFPEEIEAMCAGVGLRLTGLRRQRIGRISMAKLPEGQWRYAMPWERF